MRCQWCGTAESRYWVRGEGGPWCSEECRSASRLGINAFSVLICVASIFLIFSPIIERSLLSDITTVFFLIPFIICCPGMLFGSAIRKGLDTRKETQRGSRHSDRTIDTGAFLCANCGGALEVKSGMTNVECFYCGVTNEIAIG